MEIFLLKALDIDIMKKINEVNPRYIDLLHLNGLISE